VVTCEIKQKQNTETILKRFSIVLQLFQAHYRIYSHVEKYAIVKLFQYVVSANHQRPHTPPTMTSLMTLCSMTTVNMANTLPDSHEHTIGPELGPPEIPVLKTQNFPAKEKIPENSRSVKRSNTISTQTSNIYYNQLQFQFAEVYMLLEVSSRDLTPLSPTAFVPHVETDRQ